MKNQREIYEALLAGEALIKADMTIRKLVNDELVDINNNRVLAEGFNYPEIWQIYKEPKWYENIPDGDVLCKNTSGYIFAVKEYTGDRTHPYRARKSREPEAIPLTKQEIQTFMDNAPEDL